MHSPIVVQLIDADCSSNLLEITYIRNYASDTYSESWNLYLPDTSTVLYSSEQFPIIGTTTGTICVQRTPSLQYDLEMISTTTTSKSSLAFQGTYENRVFKSSWKLGRIRLSFYTPIFHGVFWFWTSNYSPDWKTCSTDSWSLTTGTSISSDSVIYFRRSFTGLSNMAAYESQFYYRDGIIAYLNGYEIYRDNMGTGPILPSSKPISSYSSYSYHGVIRNGYDVSESECILSVEIHLPQSVSIQFHSWLSIYASSHELSSSSICYPVAVEEVHNSYNLDMMPVADFNSSSFISFSSISTELFLVYQVPSSSVNSWRLLTSPTLCPLTSFDIQGRLDMKDEWSESNPSSSYTYSKVEYLTISVQHYNHHHYSSYKLIPREVMCFPSRMYELYPMVCHQPYSVSRSSSLFNERYEMTMGDTVNIVASNADAVGCMSDPSLPGGLAFHECSIVGSPTESVTDLMIQVYWQDDYGTMSQNITMNVMNSSRGSLFTIYLIIGVIIVVLVILLWFGCRSKKKKLPKKSNPSTQPNGSEKVVPPPVPPVVPSSSNSGNVPPNGKGTVPICIPADVPASVPAGIPSVPTGTAMSVPAGGPASIPSVPANVPMKVPASILVNVPPSVPMRNPISTPVTTPMRAPLGSPVTAPLGSPISVPIGSPIRAAARSPASIPILAYTNPPIGTPNNYPPSIPRSNSHNSPISSRINPNMNIPTFAPTAISSPVSLQPPSSPSLTTASGHLQSKRSNQGDQVIIDKNGNRINIGSLSTKEVLDLMRNND